MLEKELLKGFPIFYDIPQEHLSEISQVGKFSNFDLSQTIFQDGENAFNLFGVVDGEVELSITVRDKILKANIKYEEYVQTHFETIENDIIVDSIEPGEVFGWSALINPRLYTTTAKCSKPSIIMSLPADKLQAIFNKNSQLGYLFMVRVSEIISRRLRNRTNRLIEGWSQAFDVNRI
jgi:CRP-like cAMP-binding protein